MRFLLTLLFVSTVALGQSGLYRHLTTFSSAINHIQNNYYGERDNEELIEGAIEGVIRELDPHCAYIRKDEVGIFKTYMTGEGYGPGIEFEIIDGQPLVVSIIEGGPAEGTQILKGDILLSINGEETGNKTKTEIDLVFSKNSDEDLTLKFKRSFGSYEYEEKISPAKVVTKSIPLVEIIDEKHAYLRCSYFSATTSTELKEALEDLEDDDIEGVIIDLRNNPGGVVDESVKSAGLFLPKDSVVAKSVGKKEVVHKTYKAETDFSEDYSPYVVLLVNRGTASAAEIMTAALQDYERAYIIGANTFGKGNMLAPFVLDNGGLVMLTIGEIVSPLGRKIQRVYNGKPIMEYYEEVYRFDIADTAGRPFVAGPGGKKIYGGGGIIPDLFIDDEVSFEMKSLLNSSEFLKLAYQYSDSIASTASHDYKEFLSADWIDEDELLELAQDDGGNFTTAILKENLDRVKWAVNLLVANRLLDKKEYFRISLQKDRYIDEALKYLKTLTAN